MGVKMNTYTLILLKKLSYVASLLVVILSVTYGTEKSPLQTSKVEQDQCILPTRDLKEGEIPTGYVPCPVRQQLSYYRKNVYNKPMENFSGDPDDFFETQPIPGLSAVLENAFALVNDYIMQNIKNDADKDKCQGELRELWAKAKSLEGKLTSPQFQRFNLDLAEIIDRCKQNADTIDKGLKPGISLRINNAPVFIVYGNPNPNFTKRNILPINFVEQYCIGGYSGYIAFFDVLSMPADKKSRKDPHWSLENGTYRMLHHDYRHIANELNYLDATSADREFQEITKINIRKAILNAWKLYEHYKEIGKNNEASIIGDGLFMLIHEKPVLFYKSYEYFAGHDDLAGMVQENLSALQTMYKSSIYNYGSQKYKEEFRDWEYMLKGRYLDPLDKKIKLVHDQNGKPFLPIEYDPKLQKMTRPFADVEKNERDNLMIEALNDGATRFWDYFLYLLKQDIQ